MHQVHHTLHLKLARIICKAWHRTYKLPILITNCSNNYGPHQYPEKLILIILNALNGKKFLFMVMENKSEIGLC